MVGSVWFFFVFSNFSFFLWVFCLSSKPEDHFPMEIGAIPQILEFSKKKCLLTRGADGIVIGTGGGVVSIFEWLEHMLFFSTMEVIPKEARIAVCDDM